MQLIDAMVVKSFAEVCPTSAKTVKAAAILDQPFGPLSRGAEAVFRAVVLGFIGRIE